jgi:hypothetical protein
MSRYPTGFNASPRTAQPARRLACRQGPTAAATLYDCPSSISTAISAIVLANTTGSAVAIRLFHAIPGETFVAANAIAYDLSIAASSVVLLEIAMQLSPGDRIGYYAATGSAVTFTVYGRESPAS